MSYMINDAHTVSDQGLSIQFCLICIMNVWRQFEKPIFSLGNISFSICDGICFPSEVGVVQHNPSPDSSSNNSLIRASLKTAPVLLGTAAGMFTLLILSHSFFVKTVHFFM